MSNNQLNELDASNKTRLASLYCDNNKLAKLNLSENTELKYLYCNNNRLTELDISDNTYLQWLDCYLNQLSKLDTGNIVRIIKLQRLTFQNVKKLSVVRIMKQMTTEKSY